MNAEDNGNDAGFPTRAESMAIKELGSDKIAEKSEGYRYVAPPFTINNRFLVKPYSSDRSLKSVERNGFAMIAQKVTLVGLELLMDAVIKDNSETSRMIPKGSLVYLKEEFLHTNPGVKKVYECDAIKGQFTIVEMINVEFVVPK